MIELMTDGGNEKVSDEGASMLTAAAEAEHVVEVGGTASCSGTKLSVPNDSASSCHHSNDIVRFFIFLNP